MIQEYKKMDGEALVREYCMTGNELIKDQAVRAFLPLVKHIVGRINVGSSFLILQKDDLYQYGVVGLLYALGRFDPEHGTAFKTYAYRRIHGEIIDALRRNGVLSRDQMQKLSRINSAKEKLAMQFDREPNLQEIQKETGLTDKEITKVLSTAQMSLPVSLDETFSTDEGEVMTRMEIMEDKNQTSPDQELDEKGLRNELKGYIQELSERERLILALYYYENLTLADIGIVLNLSEGRVSQILSKVHSALRQKLRK
jgi:RNA polymerase sigma factor for flagellar operon FliA